MSDVKQLRPLGIGTNGIEILAKKVSSATGYKSGNHLVPIVSKLGGRVKYINADYGDEDEASLAVFGKGNFELTISKVVGGSRNRFSIAHEIGHYVLHSWFGERAPLVARRHGDESNRAEWEASMFAAALLMPKEEFCKLHEEGQTDLELSRNFWVSQAAVEIRRKTCGLKPNGPK